LLVFACVAWPVTASADASTYRQAVQDTLTIILSAQPGDVSAAQSAVAVLEAGTGHSQLEIIADLQLRPPDFKDAANRLNRLLDALAAPVGTADPAQAQQQLHQVLSMKRFDPLHQPPSPVDRLGQWIVDRIRDFLNLLFGGSGSGAPGIPFIYFYLLGAIAVAVAAVVIFRSTRGRLAESASATSSFGPRAPADFFADADRLAAAGDRVGAIRALCAGVAGTIAGEHTWSGSPLTVRDIFQRSSDSARLRPLLLPFEAAVYGGRDVDVATYERAALAAAPFRKPAQEAAA
jgi:hypothetical protein